jgi:F0F1-type ATP synthase epsilon subunit
MSVQTSARFNVDTLHAALPAGTLKVLGADATVAAPKAVSHSAVDDATLQAAIDAAAGQFVDRVANQATLQQRAQTAFAANATYLAIATPNAAQTTAQVQRLTRECTALIRMLLGQVDDTSGT